MSYLAKLLANQPESSMDKQTPTPWELVPHGLDFLVRRTWPVPAGSWGNARVEVMSRPDGEVRKFKSEAAARAAIAKVAA